MKSLDLAKNVLELEAQAILSLRDRLNPAFIQAIEAVKNCKGKVILTGIGKSGLIARKIASTFSSTGTASLYLHPAESSHGDLGVVGAEDVIIAISYGGESSELNSIIKYAHRKQVTLIAMTGKLKSTLALAAKIVLDISVEKEACPLELAPTASTTATLAMGDALAMVVMHERGFNAENFAENHPGGSLGFKLSKVSEVMHTGAGFIKVSETATIKEVIAKISQKETRGAAAIMDVNNALVGIITDGDIRRWLEKSSDPLKGSAKDMMTQKPKVVSTGDMAVKAINLMEQYRINVLIAVDGQNQPQGVLHIQDLIKNY